MRYTAVLSVLGVLLVGGILVLGGVYGGWGGASEPAAAQLEDMPLQWKEVTAAAPWTARDSAASAVFQDKMWIFGGINGDAQYVGGEQVKYWEAPHFNDIWWTEDGVTWEEASTTAAWPPRRSMSVVPFKGALWMFGGWSPVGAYSRDLWRSEDGIHWKEVGTVPWEAREGQIALVYHDTLFIFGGVNYDKHALFNDVWATQDGLTWTELIAHAPWSARWDHAVAVFHDTLYLTAGMDLDGGEFNDVWTSTDGATWTLATEHAPWMERQGHILLSYKDALWSLGRLNDLGGPNDIWYTKDGSTWLIWGDAPFSGREDHNGEVFNGRMWIFAGMDANWRWTHDVWSFGLVE